MRQFVRDLKSHERTMPALKRFWWREKVTILGAGLVIGVTWLAWQTIEGSRARDQICESIRVVATVANDTLRNQIANQSLYPLFFPSVPHRKLEEVVSKNLMRERANVHKLERVERSACGSGARLSNV